MDKRTRVLAAMNGEKVDHVPVGFWFHFGGDEAMGEACVCLLYTSPSPRD